jgi:hypothetical protein
MADIITFLSALWPILSAIGPIVLGVAMWWLQKQFPSKADFTVLSDKVDKVATEQQANAVRLDAIERDMDDPPTRLELLQQMAKLAAQIGQVEARTDGLGQQLRTANDYLQIIVEKGLGK